MDGIIAKSAVALWVALHLVLLLVLSGLVVRLRQRHKVGFGDDGIPELTQAIRAFGNATEYIPAGLAAVLALALVGAPPLPVHMVGMILFAGRVSHAIGLYTGGGVSIARSVGVALTWLAYVFGAAALLIYSIN